jgi:pimeloyl-ACP methyl ester carboxylesterase
VALTSTSLLVVLGLLCVAVFAAVVAGQPRLRRRGTQMASRGALVLVLNVLVLALVGAAVNDQFGFYVSWSDLAGAGSPVTVTHHGATARRAATARVGHGLAPSSAFSAAPLTAGRIQHLDVVGPHSGVHAPVTVLLPAGYSATAATRYPVIEALHGFPGSSNSWVTGMQVQPALDALVASHTIRPSIVVMPQINIPSHVDGECVNGPPGTPQVETWLARDVPEYVASHFRVDTRRSSWAVAGYSEGGWCAAMVGLRHPDVFGGDIVFSGSFQPEFTRAYRPFGTTTPARYDLIRLARNAPPPLAMWVQSAKPDGYSYPQTARFLKAVRAPLSVTTDLLKTGGHREQLWAAELPTALTWLAHAVPGFAP